MKIFNLFKKKAPVIVDTCEHKWKPHYAERIGTPDNHTWYNTRRCVRCYKKELVSTIEGFQSTI